MHRHMHSYLWLYEMDVDRVCGILDSFWKGRVLQSVGDDPRAPHCPHATLTDFVHNTGVQSSRHGFGAHMHLSVDKQTCMCYMRFRQNRWHLNSVTGAWRNRQRNCPFCPASIEDRKHVIFECPKYNSIRAVFCTLFSDTHVRHMNLACWLQQHDQAHIAACIKSMHDSRFP